MGLARPGLPPRIPAQHLFAVVVVALLALSRWPTRWLISGAPLLTYSLLLGSARGYRVLSFAPLWSLLVLINLAYSVVSTSWLLYWAYTIACYPALLLVCVCQFESAARLVRRRLRWLLNGLQFTNDMVALFDLPALEIDVDVEGLMCIRGLTISLSSLTVVAYGVEVGIKLSDDLEIALVVDKVIIKLFRRIDISDVEMEKDDPVEKEGVLAFAKGLGADIKDSMRRVAVDAAANDRWIAKLVGKVTKSLETMQGDVGYSGDIPVPLEPYRKQAETASKLMP
ncbi:hypothetical protein KVT40_008643 [Elsinoe batatas]|uniref:Uncharacterized protein n=1 Tax=Elsinoe batatas TaxID=2601811 RepID=A0A8K0KUD7_9PEZI|nr:hypothetical protein KVT40_008643 [Elsinoe batatas]